MYNGDLVIHIDKDLDDHTIRNLVRDTSQDPGVIDACISERARHLMVVDFDVKQTTPGNILQGIRQRGFSAEMLGL